MSIVERSLQGCAFATWIACLFCWFLLELGCVCCILTVEEDNPNCGTSSRGSILAA